jgi:hypothetical protein
MFFWFSEQLLPFRMTYPIESVLLFPLSGDWPGCFGIRRISIEGRRRRGKSAAQYVSKPQILCLQERLMIFWITRPRWFRAEFAIVTGPISNIESSRQFRDDQLRNIPC